MFDPPVVVDVQPAYPIGATEPGYFRTETGCSVLSSFESMSATLSKDNWGMHASPFHERNYPCDPIVLSYFGKINLDLYGEKSFKKQLYLCIIGQGLQRKTDIESWRSGLLSHRHYVQYRGPSQTALGGAGGEPLLPPPPTRPVPAVRGTSASISSRRSVESNLTSFMLTCGLFADVIASYFLGLATSGAR